MLSLAKTWTAALVLAVLVAGCAGSASSPLSGEPVLPEPAFDSLPPPVFPDRPSGAYGFTRYVFGRIEGRIEPVLVEGPRGKQVRCQREDLPCSYHDLKTLFESGAEIPEELRMTREELGELVSQLDTVARLIGSYHSIDRACAEGYHPTSTQSHNMGIHMTNDAYIMDGRLDLEKPDMLLFAKQGGEELSREELGDCVDGRWTGDLDFQPVGVAFLVPTTATGENHPDGFAGPIDNWHVHYNSCMGARADSFMTKEECEAAGGRYFEKSPWMIHVYAAPDFDNQEGVFAMWNPQIWPRVDATKVAEIRRIENESQVPAGRMTAISNFAFEPDIEVEAGENLVFRNADFAMHTVTAGFPGEPSGGFDSGPLYTGQTFTLPVDKAGEYEFFCSFHPSMRGRILVR